MSEALVPCAGCLRHHRATERACPFCGALVGAPPTAHRPGALHAAALAAALALAATQGAEAQIPPHSPRIGMEHPPIAAYGAPPHLNPGIDPDGPVAPPSTTEGALLSISHQPLREGRESGARWSPLLVIRGDGTWISDRGSGRLRPAQLASLRAAIARTRVRMAPAPAVTCDAIPTTAQRLTVGRRSVSWTTPCGTAPDPSVARLVALARSLTAQR